MTGYDWFTHAILGDGTQLIAIRLTLSKDHAATIVLTRSTSNFLSRLLNALAGEPEVDWSAARRNHETGHGRMSTWPDSPIWPSFARCATAATAGSRCAHSSCTRTTA